MESDSLSLLLECIKTCSEIESSPYGQENDDVRVEEIFMGDLLKFFVFLSYTTGDAHKREIKFVNKELHYDFNKDTFRRYAEEHVFPIEEFRYKVPLSFQYFLRAEYERDKLLYTTYRGICKKYIKAMRSVGQELIACDGFVSQEEVDNLNIFCRTLEEELSQWKGTDIYSRYGRHQISLKPEEGTRRTYAQAEQDEEKKTVKKNRYSWDRGDMEVSGRREGQEQNGGNSLTSSLTDHHINGPSLNADFEVEGRRDSGEERAAEENISLADIAEQAEHFQKLPMDMLVNEASANEELDGLLKELNDMIGLDSVKAEVNNLVNKLNISKLRVEQGFDPLPIEMHLVFTGNPGTGKTTVARLLAKIYYSLGVLSQGHFVETDRSGLVAGYMGQTAEKVQEVVDSALGGVLFIDEAYSLSNGSKEDFGKEAIDTLVKAMEDNRDNLIVIVAGYTEEMKEFLDTNPGLQSRFNTYIDFPDYESFDLVSILINMCKQMQYALAPDAVKYVYHYFEEALEHKDKNFGNARDVRNYMKHIIDKQINRITKEGISGKMDLVTIRLADVENVRLGGGIMD